MTTLAGVIALVALGTVIASLGYLHLAPTGLSPVRNAVSQSGLPRPPLICLVMLLRCGVLHEGGHSGAFFCQIA